MTIGIKTILTTSIIAGIGYQSYSKFKDFINNIRVCSLNYYKNLDATFNIDILLSNNLTSIIPYKIANIRFVNDANQIIAISLNAYDLDKTTNLKFRVLDHTLVSNVEDFEAYFKSLDVEIEYNYFLFKHTRKYQQTFLNKGNSNEILTVAQNLEKKNEPIIKAEEAAIVYKPLTKSINTETVEEAQCNCNAINYVL